MNYTYLHRVSYGWNFRASYKNLATVFPGLFH